MDNEAYETWVQKLEALNDKINALSTWNDYAEMLQHRYDILLTEDPRLKDK